MIETHRFTVSWSFIFKIGCEITFSMYALFFAGVKSHFSTNETIFPLRNIVLGEKISTQYISLFLHRARYVFLEKLVFLKIHV